MAIIPDFKLKDMIKNDGLATNIDCNEQFDHRSSIQPCSLDLKVGKIYRPDSKRILTTILGLDQGHTAIVETNEVLTLPKNVGGIVFPPAKVAQKGILFTNPGHVDPGYEGNLSFTIINMGEETYYINAGEVIGTLLLIKVDGNVEKDLKERDRTNTPRPTVFDILKILPRDFMNVDMRIKERLVKATVTATAVALIVAAFITGVFTYIPSTFSKVKDLEQRLIAIETASKSVDTNNRLTSLESQINTFSNYPQRITTLESTMARLNYLEDKLKTDIENRLKKIESSMSKSN